MDKIGQILLVAIVVLFGAIVIGDGMYNGGCGPFGPALHDSECHHVDVRGHRI